jgi:serine/threonine-protein kinase
LAPLIPAMGELIAGKYRVLSLIGEGGMGTVLAAHHELLNVPVAVKLVSPALVRHRPALDRFLREAQAVARLKSEHVARVMDVGTLEGGEPYLVMELLDGEDLERRLQRAGPMAIANAVDCILQALEAMAHAHAVGIVHRDLKPANLFATSTPDGREIIKVLDFGIAKLSDESTGARTGALTDDHSTLGSPSYMAPEQVRASRVVDHRADIWALGTILYELLTGRVAFGGQSVGEIFGTVLHKEAPRLRALRPDASTELETIIARCLEREPRHRFDDVSQLADAVAPFGSGSWDGHIARIQQTLARAGKASAETSGSVRPPARSTPPPAVSVRPPAGSERPPAPQPAVGIGVRLSVPAAYAANAAAGAETLAEAPTDSTELFTSQLRRRAPIGLLASLASLAAVGAVGGALAALLLLGSRHHSAVSRPTAVPLVEVPSPPKPPAETLTPAAVTASVDPGPAASPPAAQSASADAPQRGRASKPSHARVVPSAKNPEQHAGALPGVLDSPD